MKETIQGGWVFVMASSVPTEKEAEHLVKARKIVTASVSWMPHTSYGWRLETKALALDTKDIFRVIGTIGRDNHSFALLYKNYPIRKYTKHHKHKWNGVIYTEPHKHKWNETTRDADVYIPNDINPDDNINDQFISFCRECNIDLLGGFQPVLYEFMK
jgi:hypothetical protein